MAKRLPLDDPRSTSTGQTARVTDFDAGTQQAWERASTKHVREYDDLLAQARTAELFPVEQELLASILRTGPQVVHPQSGHGIDDVALVRAGAAAVVGLDYSTTAVQAAQRRADELDVPCRYLVAALPRTPLAEGCADLVYTGKGALIWLADLTAWASEMARLIRPGGHLFVHEAHPLVPLFGWDVDEPRVRTDRGYFAEQHVNDTFPGHGAVERQHTLAQVVMAVVDAGLELIELREHPEPFWRPAGLDAAVWDGRLPNSYSLLARRLELASMPGDDERVG